MRFRLGDVVPDPYAGRMPLASLSPSRASDFMNCPLLYRFRSVDRLPETPSPAAVRGTLVHEVLERMFDRPAAERTVEVASELLAPTWAATIEEDPALEVVTEGSTQAWLAAADRLLGTYFTLEDPRNIEPAEREFPVSTTLESGLELRGFIDRLDVAPDGRIRIVDYKTGKAPKPAYEAKALFQMRFYALAIWRMRDTVAHTLQLFYLGSAEILRNNPTEDELIATQSKVEAIADAINTSLDTGVFTPNKSRLCDWCDHRAICPAWGGTPPPMPQLS